MPFLTFIRHPDVKRDCAWNWLLLGLIAAGFLVLVDPVAAGIAAYWMGEL